jgi:hypothetical protein
MLKRLPLVAAVAGLLVCAGPAAAKTPRLPVLRNYEVRISLAMTSNFSLQPDPRGCNDEKPMGWSGSGQEILEMRSPRPVRVQMMLAGGQASLSRADGKFGFEFTGDTRRSGQMTQILCGQSADSGIDACTGRFPLSATLDMNVVRGKVYVSHQQGPDTREAIPSCDDKRFDWDGAVARTGTVLLQPAQGAAPISKLKTKGSFTLTATHHDECDLEYLGPGTCATDWTYRVNFRRVAAKKRRG